MTLNNNYFDSHCHLPSILEKMALRNFEQLQQSHFPPGFCGCITVACDLATWDSTIALMEIPGIFTAFGCHPHEAAGFDQVWEEKILVALKNPKAVALGETGLDYHHNLSPRPDQQKAFSRQIALAQKAGKPLVIHTREAEADTLAILQEQLPPGWPLYFHCFTGTLASARLLREAFPQAFFGFSGLVTFKTSAYFQEVVKELPLDRILLETDGPYLAPVPHRGTPNHPGHIPVIAAAVAKIRGIPTGEMMEASVRNAEAFFGISLGAE